MLNQDKIEKLSALVKRSKLLSENEKSDWLNLLPLMNDKQFAELEVILIPSVQSGQQDGTQPQGQQASVQPQGQQQNTFQSQNVSDKKLSSLTPRTTSGTESNSGQTSNNDLQAVVQKIGQFSHISNGYNNDQVVKTTQPSEQESKDQNKSSQSPVQNQPRTEIRPTDNTPSAFRSAFIQAGQRTSGNVPNQFKPATDSKPIVNQDNSTNSDPNPNNGSTNTDTIKPSISTDASTSSEKVLNNLSNRFSAENNKVNSDIKDLEQIVNLTYKQFRRYYFNSLLRSLQDIVVRLGYFAVLNALENSPSYQTYIRTGKMMLGDKSIDSNTTFTKQEFEQFTDMLINIRINPN